MELLQVIANCGWDRYHTGIFILQIYICIWDKAEEEVGWGWSTLSILYLAKPIRDPFALTIDVITTRTHSSLSNPNIYHKIIFSQGPNKNLHDHNLLIYINIYFFLQKYISITV